MLIVQFYQDCVARLVYCILDVHLGSRHCVHLVRTELKATSNVGLTLTHRFRLLNLAGINALLVWMSCGIISLRFRRALRVQGRSLSDLPFLQPLFPLLPAFVLILGTMMFIAQGYAAIAIQPFEARNVVATYVGVATFVVLYVGYALYERYYLKRTVHFVVLLKADVDTDAVWGPGRIRRDVEEPHVVATTSRADPLWKRVARQVY
jgi:amino acid permease